MEAAKEIKVLTIEDIKQSFKSKKIFIILAITALLLSLFYFTRYIQLFLLLMFKAEKVVSLTFLVPYYMFIILLPFLAAFLAHDSMQIELRTGSIKHIASKIKRSSIILSKFLTNLSLMSMVILLVYIFSIIYSIIKIRNIEILQPILLAIYLIFYTASFLGLTTFVSVIARKSQNTFGLALLSVIILGMFQATKTLQKLSPFYYFRDALYNNFTPIIFFLGFTLLFIFLSIFIFEKVDL